MCNHDCNHNCNRYFNQNFNLNKDDLINIYPPTPLLGGIPQGAKTQTRMEKGYWKKLEPEAMNGEVWHKVIGYDYQVSSYGRIRTCDHVQLSRNRKTYRICSGQIVRQHQNRQGYLKVHLYRGNERKSFFVHRLVAEAFVRGYASGLVVNHLNEIKSDNRAINLEWCTPKENANYGTARQRQSEAMTNNPKRSKPVQAFCKDTGSWIKTFPSQREAARQLDCALSTIQKCINRPKRTYRGLLFISQ